jgi:hypothetical protein
MNTNRNRNRLKGDSGNGFPLDNALVWESTGSRMLDGRPSNGRDPPAA